MAETQQDFHLEIAHVLFMDTVGYSKLLINEQAELLQELNRIVRNTSQFRNAEAVGELIRLPTGDGMALVFLRSAEAPVQCAIEISQALRSSPEIRLRMGVHSGPVNQVTDVNDRSNLAGAGINIAQRVMALSDQHYIPPVNIALVYNGLGDQDEALSLLKRACEERDVRLVLLKVDPRWDTFRSDPRFGAILKRIGLE